MKFYYDIQIEKDRDVPSGRRHGRDDMVVGFTTAYAISAYHH